MGIAGWITPRSGAILFLEGPSLHKEKKIGDETCGESSIPVTLYALGMSPGRRNVNLKKGFPRNTNSLRWKHDEMKTSASRASGLFAACGPQRRGPTLWQALACSIAMFAATAAFSADPDLARAGQFVREGKYQEAYDLLLPFQSGSKADSAFNALLGEAALRTNRAASGDVRCSTLGPPRIDFRRLS